MKLLKNILKLKTKVILYFLVILTALLLIIYYFNSSDCNQFTYKNKSLLKEISSINQDTLSKYYQLFRVININKDYLKKDFMLFVESKNKVLYNKLNNENILLNSKVLADKYSLFEGFYHIGFDKINDSMKFIINNPELNYCKKGDIIISTYNYFKLDINYIYKIKKDSFYLLNDFNTINIFASSLKCDGKVEMRLDTLSSIKYNNLFFHKGSIFFDKQIDSNSASIIENYLNKKEVIQEDDLIYIPFTYKKLDNFYCE
jgi:hypothetical protein